MKINKFEGANEPNANEPKHEPNIKENEKENVKKENVVHADDDLDLRLEVDSIAEEVILFFLL